VPPQKSEIGEGLWYVLVHNCGLMGLWREGPALGRIGQGLPSLQRIAPSQRVRAEETPPPGVRFELYRSL